MSGIASSVLYVYGFVRAHALEGFCEEGVGGADATVIEGDDVAAIVSPVLRSRPRLKRRDLDRHLRVIESAFGSTTILPCAFGTTVDSGTELEVGVLAGARDDLLAGLERLEGKVQMNVKAIYDEQELLREIVLADPQVAELRERTRGAGNAAYDERLQLGEIVAARIDARASRDAVRLMDALAEPAVDVVPEPTDGGSALRAAFLVDRKSLRRFEAALEALARVERPMLRFEAIGPLPPTAFAAAYTRA
jgi:hypothetical protein